VTIPAPGQVSVTPEGRSFLAAHRGAITGTLLGRECPGYASLLSDMGDVRFESERSADQVAAVWMVRAGEAGRFAFEFVDRQRIMVGWGATGELEGMDREAVSNLVADSYSELAKLQRGQIANALFRVASEMRVDDMIITPEPSSRTLLLGRITGDYDYVADTDGCEDYNHQRVVTWLARVSRDDFSYGARQSLGT